MMVDKRDKQMATLDSIDTKLIGLNGNCFKECFHRQIVDDGFLIIVDKGLTVVKFY